MQHTFKADKPCRLSTFLRQNGVSRSLMCALKQTECGITVNGAPAHTDYMLAAGDIAAINEPSEHDYDITPSPLPAVPVIYEDSELIVFDKPPLMPTHQSMGHNDDTLANFYAHYTNGSVFRCLNRLDRDTSGCCLVALSRYGVSAVSGTVSKTYYAVCEGEMPPQGVIDLPIRRCDDSFIKRECAPDGQQARTLYKTLAVGRGYSLCEITLETGRTHQIRVHFSSVGHPLAGDDMYGGSRGDISRQALHCGRISFITPADGKRVTVRSPIPQDMRRIDEELFAGTGDI